MAYATGRGLSQRRACTLMGVARSALAYRPVTMAKDAPVVARMAELSAQYPLLMATGASRSSSPAMVTR